MSTTIDQRVVEMRFDNQHFEKNVATTMSTLDKLKQKLHLDGASKGLENINSAAKNVKMDGLGSAVDTVSTKFSALQVMGVTALANITNSAVNAGKKIVSALTIDPVKSGFNEYELKMNSVQTIMSSTGASIETVNAYLEELNKYSDQTIYSFQDMTQNIGKFTNAGVNLEDAVAAIKGISNEAAVSGANANEASRAMYNFAQALSAGYVKLIDWKSIENANMATVEFKQQLIDAAVAAGTLTDAGDGLYKTLDGTVMNATKNFNDTLQDQWMTSEVLITTLKKYADETTDIGKKASAAATEVKTFTMLFDTLKEAAQSGWAQTWELMFGDLEEAKVFFTGLSDLIGGLIGDMSNWRNNILGDVFDSNYDKLVDKIGDAGLKVDDFHGAIRKLLVANGETNESIDETIEKYGGMEEAIRGGAFSTEILKEALKDIGIDGSKASEVVSKFAEALEKIERMLGYGSVGDDVKTLQEVLEALGHSVGECGLDGIIGPDTTAAIKEFQKEMGLTVDGIAGPETLAALKKASKSIDKVAESAENAAVSYDDLLDNITKKGGRELFLEGFKNAIGAIVDVLKVLGQAWTSVFPAEVIQQKLMKLIEGFNKFTKSLRLFTEETVEVTENGETVEKTVSKLTDTGEKLKSVFEGLFSAVKIVATILSGPLRTAASIITKILGNFGITILDVAASLGDWLTTISNSIDTVTDFIADSITEWIKQFKETEFFKTVAGWVKDAAKTISDAVDNISERIKNFNTSTFVERLKTFSDFISTIAKQVADSEIFIAIVDGVCAAFAKIKEFFGRFKLPEFNIDNLKTFSSDLVKIGEKIGGSGSSGFIGAITGFGKHLKDNVLSWNWTVFKETALEKFTTFWLKTGDKIKAAFEKGKEVALAIKRFIFGTEEVSLPAILGVVEKFLGIALMFKALQTLNALVSPFDNITDALNNFATSLKWDAMASAFKSLALALAAFTLCIVVITNMGDMKKAWSAAGMLIALMVVMGAVVSAMAFFASKVDGGLNAAGAVAALLMLVGSIAILVHTLKEIDKLNLNNTGRTFLILAGILVALTAGVRMISKAGGSSFRSVAAILTLMAALKLILEVIEDYDKFDWSGKSGAIKKMVQMLFALSLAINLASRGTKAGASSSGLALTLIAMVVSLKILIGVMEDFAAMDTNTLIKGGGTVVALLAVMTLMAAVLSSANKGSILEKGQKSVNNFTGLAMALLAVVAAIWLLGKMDTDTLMQGGFAVGQVLLLFTAMLAIIGKSCAGLKIGSIITMVISIGILMTEMTAIIKYLESVPWQSSLSSAGALAALLLAMSFALRSLTKYDVSAGNIFKWVGAMALLGLVIGEIGFVLSSMKNINPASAVGSAAALGILITSMALAMLTLTKYDASSGNIYKWIGAMAVLGLVVGELAFVLYSIKQMDPLSAVGSAAALSVLLGAMTVVLSALSKLTFNVGSIATGIAALAALGLVVWEIGAIVRKLTENGLDGSAIGAVGAISAMLVVMTGVLAACAGLGLILQNPMVMLGLAVAVAALAALGLVVWEIGAIIRKLKQNGLDGSAIETVNVLSKMLTALTAVLAALTVIGIFGVGAIAGVAAMALLGLVVWELGAILKKLQTYDLDQAMPTVDVLSALLNNLTGVLAKLTVIGVFAVAALAGVIALTTMITLIGGLAIAIGLLTKDGALIDKGMVILQKIAGGIGEVIGSFALGLTSSLPEIGANLSAFVEAARPFITMVAGIGDDVATGAGNLVLAIGALLAADFVSKIVDKLGGISLTDLAVELSGFADNISGFISTMSTMKPETAEGVKALCDAMSALTGATFWNGLNDIIFGKGSLSSFGTSISEFATCIKDAAASLKNITDEDVANIKRSATAGEALADLNGAIPAQGGWAQTIMGSKDLAAFGASVNAFADCLVSYSKKVSGQNIDANAITASATAAQSIADLNGAIPAQGGWAQTIMGSQELATFGASIVTFAGCLVDYSAKVTGQNLDAEAITASAGAAEALASLNGKLPSQNGLYQAVMGEKNLGEFGTQLISFADGIVAYANAATQIDEAKITAITNSGKAIDELVLVMKKIPSGGGWGDAIFGSKDGQSFGDALSSVASGIASYCATAATIGDDDITAIQKSKTAVTELGTVLSNVPETSESQKATAFLTAVNNIKSIASTINQISTAGYDYSGLSKLKSQMTGLSNLVGNIDTAAISIGFQQLHTAIKNAASCAKKLVALNDYTYDGISRFKKALKDLSGADVDSIISAFSGKADDMASAMKSLTNAMTSGLNAGSNGVSNAMKTLVNKVIKAARDKTDDFKTAGKSFATNLANGIKNETGSVSAASKTLGTKAAAGAREKYSGMHTAGKYLGTGLVNGIQAKWTAAYNAGYTLGQMAVQGEKDGQQSKSPSKATIKAGKWLGEGLVIGINRMGSSVYEAGRSMGKDAVGSISNSISKISDLVSTDIDAQPTIRPVLDLSDVRAGAGAIGGMFGDANFGVSANLGAISSMMNSRGQNGANDDVISAIEKLRKDLGNVGGTTYQINGITYDDGSNIHNAVKEIARHAILERRI